MSLFNLTPFPYCVGEDRFIDAYELAPNLIVARDPQPETPNDAVIVRQIMQEPQTRTTHLPTLHLSIETARELVVALSELTHTRADDDLVDALIGESIAIDPNSETMPEALVLEADPESDGLRLRPRRTP